MVRVRDQPRYVCVCACVHACLHACARVWVCLRRVWDKVGVRGCNTRRLAERAVGSSAVGAVPPTAVAWSFRLPLHQLLQQRAL